MLRVHVELSSQTIIDKLLGFSHNLPHISSSVTKYPLWRARSISIKIIPSVQASLVRWSQQTFYSSLKYKAKQDLSHNHQIFINAFLVLLLNINKN